MQGEGKKKVLGTTWKAAVVVPLMFAFVFVVMVPLYNLLCDVTGLNGKTKGRYTAEAAGTIDESRSIMVRFVATNNEGMSWEFHPTTEVLRVHPGAENATTFFARNPSTAAMTAQAVPSIVPSSAVAYFHKTECFCFSQQHLSAGESADMPLRFIVDKDLPAAIRTITLSYTLFDVTPKPAAEKATVAALD
ncbi:MAG TPA: cytochrome c oxidase assembly protein [Pseudomonadales bacterium]